MCAEYGCETQVECVSELGWHECEAGKVRKLLDLREVTIANSSPDIHVSGCGGIS